uniref:COMM domain-containing protein 5 n=1 Tax=Coccolithus braarudii TaxID=221442 RepID=A0A7S0L3G0_9EUKA
MSAFYPISYEAQLALRQLPQLERIDELLAAALRYACGSAPTARTLEQLVQVTGLEHERIGTIFTGLHWLLRACMRSGLKAKPLAVELEELRVHAPFVAPIIAAAESGRDVLCETTGSSRALTRGKHAGGLPTLRSMRWRLDVPISTELLPKVLRPHLTLHFTLTDGTEVSFHASKQRFDELRYTVAKLLVSLQEVQTRLPPLAT